MAQKQKSKWCWICEIKTLHVKQELISVGMWWLLSIITGGLFLLLWIPLIYFDALGQPWRCQQCGAKN